MAGLLLAGAVQQGALPLVAVRHDVELDWPGLNDGAEAAVLLGRDRGVRRHFEICVCVCACVCGRIRWSKWEADDS